MITLNVEELEAIIANSQDKEKELATVTEQLNADRCTLATVCQGYGRLNERHSKLKNEKQSMYKQNELTKKINCILCLNKI